MEKKILSTQSVVAQLNEKLKEFGYGEIEIIKFSTPSIFPYLKGTITYEKE